MTRGFALITENGTADVWVMDPAVNSVEQTINMPWWALDRVRSVQGVQSAVPLVLGSAEARFPNGRFQPFQVIGLDDATLAGLPAMRNGARPAVLRTPDAAAVDPGGTTGKLETSLRAAEPVATRSAPSYSADGGSWRKAMRCTGGALRSPRYGVGARTVRHQRPTGEDGRVSVSSHVVHAAVGGCDGSVGESCSSGAQRASGVEAGARIGLHGTLIHDCPWRLFGSA